MPTRSQAEVQVADQACAEAAIGAILKAWLLGVFPEYADFRRRMKQLVPFLY